jgi:sugar/nucleoside kinase (ribokinase family)
MVDIISLGEMLVEIMRVKVDTPHSVIGEDYKGPYPSGAPVIFISSAARMAKPYGMTSAFIGVVGSDGFGKGIIDALERDGVNTAGIVSSKNHTGVAFNQYNSDGSRTFIFCAGAAGETNPSIVKEDLFKGIKLLHIMGSALSISESSRDAVYKAIEIALKINPNVEISLDPNLRPEMLPIEQIIKICKPVVDVTTIILPSGEEAEMLAQKKGAKDACNHLFNIAPRLKVVVLKMGKKGAMAITKTEKVEVAGYKVQEVDATGAGDSFGGGFVVEYLKGKPLNECLKFANAVGALKVTNFGPIPNHSREFVETFMRSQK